MARIEGVERLAAVFRRMAAKVPPVVSVVVGFEAGYASYVHENLAAHHPQGQAKFLEGPAREYARQIGQTCAETYRRTKDVRQSLLVGGLFLQRKSQEVVPVATGNLRASAFVSEE